MPTQSCFEVYGRSYPVITLDKFRMGDPVLVTEVTGLTWPEFEAGAHTMEQEYRTAIDLGNEDEFQGNPIILTGLMAVAFWHGNPMMTRAKVVKAVERIPIVDVDFIPGEEDDVGPPAETEAAGEKLPQTSNGSDPSQERSTETTPPVSSSDAMSPNGSGFPQSPSSHPESLPA